MTEWYLNGPLGIEQGLTIQERPGTSKGGPLTLAFKLSGDLAASVDVSRRGMTLAKNGSPVLRYRDLVVSDAGGRQLRAWLETSGHELRIRVDDAGASYPLVVDPVAQAVKLTSCESSNYANFGYNVALSGDGKTAVALSSGAAWVFQEPGGLLGGWGGSVTPIVAAAKLVATDTTIDGSGGVTISGDGSVIAVGLSTIHHDTFPYHDAVTHVFVRPGTSWSSAVRTPQTQSASLVISGGEPTSSDGPAISADGNTIVVAVNKSSGAKALYLYTKPSGGWANVGYTAQLSASDDDTQPLHGLDISGDAGTIAVGLAGKTVGDNANQGAVYVFVKPSGGWTGTTQHETAQLTASDGAELDQLGFRVALDYNGGIFVASAPKGGGSAGAVYLFEKPSGSWANGTQNAKLTPSDGTSYDIFGQGLDIDHDGNTVAVGTFPTGNANPGVGRTYFFAKPANGWADAVETQKITPTDSVQLDGYSYSVGLSDNGSITAVGAPYQDTSSYQDVGAMYIFTGYAGTPTASVSPSSLTFGNQTVGTTSATQPVTLTNTGNAPLHVSSVVASSQFTTTQNCVTTIAQGASCTENVAFAPTSPGAAAETLTFTDDSGGTGGTTQEVQLSGTGLKASSTTSITSVSPSPALVGQSVTVSFAVTPPSGNSLTPTGTVTVSATPAGTNCTATLPATSCALTFSSVGTQTLTASYSGDANFAASTSSSVSLTVRNYAVYVTPASRVILAGKSGTYTVTVVGANGFTGQVALSCAGGPAGTGCTVTPASVNLSSSTTAASATATVSVPSQAAKGSYNLTFTGTYGAVSRTASASLKVR